MNRVSISGCLTRDPELSYTGDLAICKTGVAVIERKKTGDEWVDVPHFINITYFGRRGELMAEKAKKGDRVYVDGRLHFSQWETDDGTKRNKLEVVCQAVEGEFNYRPSEGGTPTTQASTPAAAADTDDIPF